MYIGANGVNPENTKGIVVMKKTDKTYKFKVTIEGLTLQDIIEILAMKEKTENNDKHR